MYVDFEGYKKNIWEYQSFQEKPVSTLRNFTRLQECVCRWHWPLKPVIYLPWNTCPL